VELLPVLLEALGFTLASRTRDPEERARERRQSEIDRTLEAVAFALFGRHVKPWFRAPRAVGRIDGREVEVVWLGKGHISVRGVARETTELTATPPGWFARTFMRATSTVSGRPTALHEDARRLVEGGVLALTITSGQLVATARCRLDAEQILGTVRRIMTVAWASPDGSAPEPAVVVKRSDAPVADAPGPRAPAGAESDLRCPFCHDAMGAVVVRCDACDAPHHPSCFEEGHGCSIAGCRHQRARGSRVQV
jgi:hypothetical protein